MIRTSATGLAENRFCQVMYLPQMIPRYQRLMTGRVKCVEARLALFHMVLHMDLSLSTCHGLQLTVNLKTFSPILQSYNRSFSIVLFRHTSFFLIALCTSSDLVLIRILPDLHPAMWIATHFLTRILSLENILGSNQLASNRDLTRSERLKLLYMLDRDRKFPGGKLICSACATTHYSSLFPKRARSSSPTN